MWFAFDKKELTQRYGKKKKTDFSIVPPTKNTILALVFSLFLSTFRIHRSRSGIIESSKGKQRTRKEKIYE
jgi:hypothetical protein